MIEDGEYHRHVENYYEDGECNERTASNNNIKVENTIDMLRTLKTMNSKLPQEDGEYHRHVENYEDGHGRIASNNNKMVSSV